jgi:CBS domain-containing protein
VIVVDDTGRLAGMLTRGDVLRIVQAGSEATTTVLEAANPDVAFALPDETLQTAISRMLTRDIGRLPVVDTAQAGKVIGYLGRADILAARSRLHKEEGLREKGPLFASRPS